jgi:hypothetical protein
MLTHTITIFLWVSQSSEISDLMLIMRNISRSGRKMLLRGKSFRRGSVALGDLLTIWEKRLKHNGFSVDETLDCAC